MKLLRRLLAFNFVLAVQILFIASFTGCETGYNPSASSPAFSDIPPELAASPSVENAGITDADRFHVGDTVTVTFSGLSTAILPHEEQIKEDGTITLNLIGPVKANGKTAGELQKEIQDLYVPKYYVRMTVTVNPKERSYSVGGEVKSPGPKFYIAGTTVIKAIQAAGDFTDYAKKTRVQLTRANGTTIIVNCKKALKDPSEDPPVFPGDTIHVPRRFF